MVCEVSFVRRPPGGERMWTSWCWRERMVESWREVRLDASVKRTFILDDASYADKQDLKGQVV